MYSRKYYGSFYPVISTIHSLNPIIKLINFIIMMLLLILTNSKEIHLFMIIFVLINIFLSRVPFNYYFNTFYFFRYFYLIIAFICAYFDIEFIMYLVYVSKIIIFSLYLNVLVYTTSDSETIYGIEKSLSFFNFLYLKVSKLAFKINNMLRYHSLYMNVKNNILIASSIRGNKICFFDIKEKIKLHLRTKNIAKIKSSETLSSAQLRLYDINKQRTNFRTNKVGFYDILFLSFNIVLLFIYCIEEGLI